MKKIIPLALTSLPVAAFAHMGEQAHTHGLANSFLQGFAHPFTGADHLAAMLAVGAWSALTFPRLGSAWRVPTAFVALLVAGAVAGLAGLWMPGVEPMIAASVLVLGLLVAVQKQMPWVLAAALARTATTPHSRSCNRRRRRLNRPSSRIRPPVEVVET